MYGSEKVNEWRILVPSLIIVKYSVYALIFFTNPSQIDF